MKEDLKMSFKTKIIVGLPNTFERDNTTMVKHKNLLILARPTDSLEEKKLTVFLI